MLLYQPLQGDELSLIEFSGGLFEALLGLNISCFAILLSQFTHETVGNPELLSNLALR